MNDVFNDNLNEVNQINEQLHNDAVSDQLNKEQDTIFEDAQREIADMYQEDNPEIDEEKLKATAGSLFGSYDFGAQRAKDNTDTANSISDTKESMLNSWETFFKKAFEFLTGKRIPEFQSVYDKLNEYKQKQMQEQKQGLNLKREQVSDNNQKKYPELHLQNRTFQGFGKPSPHIAALKADVIRGGKKPTKWLAHESYFSDSTTDDMSKKSVSETRHIKTEAEIMREVNQQKIEAKKISDLIYSAGQYEYSAKRAKESYEFALNKMNESVANGKDPNFWNGTADRAIRDMEFYAPKAAEAKAKLETMKL